MLPLEEMGISPVRTLVTSLMYADDRPPRISSLTCKAGKIFLFLGGGSVRTAQVIILITLLKKKIVRGDPPPCGFTPRTGNYSYHPKKKKIVRGDSPPHLLAEDICQLVTSWFINKNFFNSYFFKAFEFLFFYKIV